ncbi:apoptosis inducing factor family protein [Catalinimonas niigatensis]|uniref:apoptosis inducing factor family protein n=1 Tax=Catalinimonas niigatensis TaxID=1397264 RepID=UPI002667176D|nr:apoptosis inducing factor family protein [Catalinimonas niigatensis]WPP52605.1 FAD-dependent oxidoreductase [Catalinimonas niigatensis]
MTFQQAKVARVSELAPGEMKQVKVGDTEVLLACYQDEFFATAAHCTHYGAPLEKGFLHGKRVVCPWHHACFDITNGDHLEPPGCNSLPSFEVSIVGEEVMVKVPNDAPEQREPDMQSRDKANPQLNLIIGAGTAAQYAAEAMRSSGYSGRILMLTKEAESPYDRVNCSKEYLQDEAPEEWMALRPPEFYEKHAIEIMKEASVIELNTHQKEVRLSDGQLISYDKVLICTGGDVQKPEIMGVDLDNVFTLRSLKDSREIKEKAKKAKKVVVIGASFIGMEGAWSISTLDCEVTVVAPVAHPFAPVWGDEVGMMIQKLHEEQGIQFRLGHKVSRLQGDTRVNSVVLDNGEELEADLVLIGVGVKPATSYVKGVALAEDGGIVVDKNFNAGKDIYAAGDIAHFPYKGGLVRIEHWRVACQQGRIAGYNMAGQYRTYESVPFFWTAQQGLNIRYVGHVKDYDDIIYHGKVEEKEFLAFYIKESKVKAVLGVNRDVEMAILEELLRLDQMPDPSQLKQPQLDLKAYLLSVSN